MRILLLFFTIIFSLGCNDKKESASDDTTKESSPETKTGFMLKGKHNFNKGDIHRSELEVKVIDGNMKMTIPSGQEIDGIWNMEVSKRIDVEVLETSESKATKYKINIVKDTRIMSQKIAGNLNEQETPNPLTGKTIIGEKKSDVWSFRLEKDDATTEELKALKKIEKNLFKDGEFDYPETPISVGETWSIPKSKLTNFLGGDSPIESGSGSLKLIEILNDKNKKRALIALSIQAKTVPDETGLTMEMSMEGQYYRDLENFIDVDFDMKGQLKASGELPTPDGSKILVIMEGPSTMTSTQIINPEEIAVEPVAEAQPNEEKESYEEEVETVEPLIEFRTWTAINGKKVEAEFVSNEEGIVKLKLNSGKIFEVPANKLSKEDNEFIGSLAKTEGVNLFELEIRDSDGLAYIKDSDTPYTGKMFLLWKNGKKDVSNYKNGELDGFSIKWHENGQKMTEGNWKNDKPVKGSVKYWNSKGEPVDSWLEAHAKAQPNEKKKDFKEGLIPSKQDLRHKIIDNEAVIISCNKNATGSITIPEKINGHAVTLIQSSAFNDCNKLTAVHIPNGVTSIGEKAFQNCLSLKSVFIPNTITKIGRSAFRGCEKLEKIIIPDSVTSTSGGIVAIEADTFYDCKSLRNVIIPNSVTKIGSSAFSGCESLEEIIIPDSVNIIGNYAFSGCSTITRIQIPDGVTIIDSGSFQFCDNLNTIEIPDSVTSIGNGAFLFSKNLTEITIPKSLTSIGKEAFHSCWRIKSLTIPKGVINIGENAFYGNDLLSDLIFLGDAPETEGDIFCEQTTPIIYRKPEAKGWTDKWSDRPVELISQNSDKQKQPVPSEEVKLISENVHADKLEFRGFESIAYLIDSNIPYTGSSTEFYKNGEKKTAKKWKNGKLDGLSTSWHENGKKKEELNYKDDEAISVRYWNNKGEEVDSLEEAEAE